MAMTTVNVTKDWTLLTSSISLIQFKNNSVQLSVGALPTDNTSFFELSSGDFFSNNSAVSIYARVITNYNCTATAVVLT